jgi:hypothetical protein
MILTDSSAGSDIHPGIKLMCVSTLNDNRRLLWDYAFRSRRENNVTDVIISDGLVYASSDFSKAGTWV